MLTSMEVEDCIREKGDTIILTSMEVEEYIKEKGGGQNHAWVFQWW